MVTVELSSDVEGVETEREVDSLYCASFPSFKLLVQIFLRLQNVG